jgi:NADH-quinone oxidoreductase subunit E
MKRYDLRACKERFEVRMLEILNNSKQGEVLIFLFESIPEEQLKEVMGLIEETKSDVLNSLKFNEVDWMVVARAKGLYEQA